MENIENILIIRRAAIGDIIFTLPAYYMLKANFPHANISYLVKDSYASVLKGFPGLDQVLVINTKALSSRKINQIWKTVSDLFHTIRANNYQLVVDLSGQREHALLLWLCGIKYRWGFMKSRKLLHSLLYTITFVRQSHRERHRDPSLDMHRIDQHLQLLKKGGLSSFPIKNEYIVPTENIEKAKALFDKWGLSLQSPTIFIQPFTGATTAGKIWPLARYVALADYWKDKGVQVVFGGGPSEREKLSYIATRFPIAAGQSDFVTSVGLTMLSSMVVGGDTGLLHAALAVGKRTVMLAGPTNYNVIGPYQHPEWVVIPQNGYSMDDISVEQVIEATKKAFNEILPGNNI